MVKNRHAVQETQVLSLGRAYPPGGGNGNPLQYSCLGNLKDRGAWWATVHGVAKSQTWLSDETRASCTLKSSVILGRLVAQAPYLKPDTACQRQVVLILCFPFIASQPGFFLAGPES